MALIKEVLWNVVIGNENAPENQGKQVKSLLWRYLVLATIVLSVDPTLLPLLGLDPDSQVVVWKNLADQFQKNTWVKELSPKRRLYNLKLKARQLIQKHVKMLTEILVELSIIGFSFISVLFCKLKELKVFKLQRSNIIKIQFIKLTHRKSVENQKSYHQVPYNHKNNL